MDFLKFMSSILNLPQNLSLIHWLIKWVSQEKGTNK